MVHKDCIRGVVHEVVIFMLFCAIFKFSFVIFHFLLYNANTILSLEFVYEEKCLTLMGPVICELQHKEPSLGLNNSY